MKRSRVPFESKLRPEMTLEIVPDSKGRGLLLLPTPALIADAINSVPPGSLISISALRTSLARKHGADLTCPLMTGIFFNLLAGAAEEQFAEGRHPVAPYWRVVLDGGGLSGKTPDGPERQAERLLREGVAVQKRGTMFVVEEYERLLVD